MKMNPDAFHGPPEEEVTLCKAWVRISEDSVVCNMKREVGFWIKVLDYVDKKLNVTGGQTYDSLNEKWKTLRPKVAQFYGVYNNTIRRAMSGTGDGDYTKKALQDIVLNMEYRLHFFMQGSFNLNMKDGNDEENRMQEVQRPMGRDGSKKKVRASKATFTADIDEALAVFDNEERRSHCLFRDQKEGARNKAINVGNARI
ncbi:hypothetical protein Tco_0360503 [Tanacetum coccineum]